MKRLLASEKSKDASRVLASIQSQPDSPDKHIDTWLCTVPLRESPRVSLGFVVGRMVLLWGNTHLKICSYGGIRQPMHGQ